MGGVPRGGTLILVVINIPHEEAQSPYHSAVTHDEAGNLLELDPIEKSEGDIPQMPETVDITVNEDTVVVEADFAEELTADTGDEAVPVEPIQLIIADFAVPYRVTQAQVDSDIAANMGG